MNRRPRDPIAWPGGPFTIRMMPLKDYRDSHLRNRGIHLGVARLGARIYQAGRYFAKLAETTGEFRDPLNRLQQEQQS